MNKDININELIQSEVDRLSKRYNKDFLDCADIMKITGLGRDKVREMMNSNNFPTSKFGRKKTVGLASFVIWQMKNNTKGGLYNEIN